MVQGNLSTKQIQTDKYREQSCGCQGGEGWGRKWDRHWGEERESIIFNIDKG